jgi:two-component system, OmpR family, response regulator PrrA
VLLVEDDPLGANFMRRVLSSRGYAVEICSSGDAAIQACLSAPPDVMVLDWHLPGTHGRDVCVRVRAGGADVPILVLTGDNSELVVEEALAAGADDHAHKLTEQAFLARLDALVRRRAKARGQPVEIGGLIVDAVARVVSYRGADLKLSRLEFEIVYKLALEKRRWVSRAELQRAVWGEHATPSSNVVDSRIRHLRTKLGPAREMLRTMRRVGYCLCEEPPEHEGGGG